MAQKIIESENTHIFIEGQKVNKSSRFWSWINTSVIKKITFIESICTSQNGHLILEKNIISCNRIWESHISIWVQTFYSNLGIPISIINISCFYLFFLNVTWKRCLATLQMLNCNIKISNGFVKIESHRTSGQLLFLEFLER